MTTNSEFSSLERSFERFNRRNSASRVFRDSLRSNDRLRSISRQSPLGRAGVNSASILGGALLDNIFQQDPFGLDSGSLGGARQGSTNTASGLGGIFDNSSVQSSLLNAFSNLIEGLFNQATTRTSTRTTSAESQRSQDFSNRWNTSRSQQDAELAAIVQRGLGQL